MISSSKECTGCGACQQICPKKCITMAPDKEGFLYPVVDESKCVKCGRCVKVCQLEHIVPEQKDCLENVKAWAAKLRNKEKVMKSASGGAFVAIAEYILENEGIVFGCAYNEKMQVIHRSVSRMADLPLLQSSKYVQSNTLSTFAEAKKYLDEGRIVLYSGTPCQIAGLRLFLGNDYDKLYTIDLICHGVPSPMLFQKYLVWLGKENGGRITRYNFRDKRKRGWNDSFICSYSAGNNERFSYAEYDPYFKHFLLQDTYRECCYNCLFSKPERCADFTIGDYWGIQHIHPEFEDSTGVSALIANTRKGVAFLSALENKVDLLPTKYHDIRRYNHNLNMPTPRNSEREHIYIGIMDKDASSYIRSIRLNVPLLKQISCRIPKKYKRMLRRLLKKG